MSEIKIERSYKYGKEVIWEALTRKEYIKKWLMDTDFELEKDFKFTLVDKEPKGWDGTVHCKVIDFDTYHFVSYQWNNDKSKTVSVVKWTIEEQGNETLLKLQHTGFKGVTGFFTKMILGAGWKGIMKKDLEPIFEEINKEISSR